MKPIIIAVFLLVCQNLLAQPLTIKYPRAGEAIIRQKSKDISSKDTVIDLLSIKYYYEGTNLIYFVTHEEPNVELIKIYNKQYHLQTDTKSYLLKDTATDLNIATFFMRKFLDSSYIHKIVGDHTLRKTELTKKNKLYAKFSFTEKIDSINTDATTKILLNATSNLDFIVDKGNGQMKWAYETFKSQYITFFSEEELISLKEQPVELIKNFINNKLTTVITTYTLKKEDVFEKASSIKTDINPEMIKNISFPVLNTRPLVFKNIKQDYTLIDFWFPGCVPCMKSIPELNKIQLNLGNTVKVISVNAQKADVAFMLSFCKKQNMTYLVAQDDERKITNLFDVFIFPSWVLINKEGKVIDSATGIEPDLFKRVKLNITSKK